MVLTSTEMRSYLEGKCKPNMNIVTFTIGFKGVENLNAYDEAPRPMQRHSHRRGDWVSEDLEVMFETEEDEDEDSWVDEESRLRPPALPTNLEAALAKLPGRLPTYFWRNRMIAYYCGGLRHLCQTIKV